MRTTMHTVSESVSTIQEIKTAIEHLPLEERAELVAELCGWSDDDWDRQMKADAKAGKFTALNRDAAQAQFTGETRPLPEILGET